MSAEAEQPQQNDDAHDHRWNRRCLAIHRIQLSVLYHHKRERFFDSIDRVITALTLVSATAAAAMIFQSNANNGKTYELWTAIIAAVASSIAVAFTPANKARTHGQLAAEMRRLWAQCEKAGEEWTHEECDEFTAAILNTEAGEAAQLGALVAQCENEIAVASGHLENIRELRWWRSLLMHWWNFDTTCLKRISEKKLEEMRSSRLTPEAPSRSSSLL